MWLQRLVPREFCNFTFLLMQTVETYSIDQQDTNEDTTEVNVN